MINSVVASWARTGGSTVSGITRYGSYLPYSRLERSTFGSGRGQRTAAGYDEDSVSMAVEAARDVVREESAPDTLILATTSPPYAEKLNAAALQAALNLSPRLRSLELGGSSRMGLAALLLGFDLATAGERALVCASDVVVGAPGGPREAEGGDGAVAFGVGSDEDAIARVLGRASATTEVLDVWRKPEDRFATQWEERFGAEVLGPVIVDTATRALQSAGVQPTELTTVVLDSTNARAAASLPRALRLKPDQVADPLATSVGRTGAAHAGLLLARTLDGAGPGERILVVSAGDGCDAVVLETTAQLASRRPLHSVDRWLESKRDDLTYVNYLRWRGVLPFEPPRRPDPERPAAPASRRSERWKLGFMGARCRQCGTGQLPPQRVCFYCSAVDDMVDEPFADTPCRVTTYTLDRLAYSLQPPVVAAVVDFDGGGRMQCELTDVDPDEVEIGSELEMTFRRLYTGQGVHNYFWKARPRR